MAGDGRQQAEQLIGKNIKYKMIKQWKTLDQTEDVVNSFGFVGVIAARFVGSGEHDVNPRPIQGGRIGGPGRKVWRWIT